MTSQNKIDITFCRRIAYEEWRTFRLAQDKAIEARLKRDTGTLHAGGAGRRYSISNGSESVVLHLIHPDYERYQDMKRLRHGRTNSRLHTAEIRRSQGKKIHNAIIWGRMNVIAFRCMNDLRGEVFKFVRESVIATRQLNIKM